MRFNLEIVGAMHTRHPSPLGFDVVVFHETHRAFHVIQEEFRIKAEGIEQAVVEVKGEGTVVAVFGVVTLFHEQGNRRNEQPRLQVIVLDLQFADTESCIAHGKFVTVTKDVAGLIDIAGTHARKDAQVSIERKHAQRAKLHV